LDEVIETNSLVLGTVKLPIIVKIKKTDIEHLTSIYTIECSTKTNIIFSSSTVAAIDMEKNDCLKVADKIRTRDT